MRRVLGLILLGVILLVCVAFAATQSLTNRTGSTATGVIVTFSEQVRSTSYDKGVFPTQSPASGEAESFTFSGGTLPAGGTFQVTWSPSTAKLRSTKWITSGSATATTASQPTIPTTYEEIMAQIAHYPGPDEPLYVPAKGEAIWLTDLGGHTDIYDNDSIRVNYAPWFDKSQITKVEVYRNGIKMRFLPDKLDILTNEQMKTFDGNPTERTPKSSHSDHAIFGYEYEFRFYTGSSPAVQVTRAVAIQSPVSVGGTAFVQAGEIWLYLGSSDEELRSGYRRMKSMGFEGIQFTVDFFMASDTANEVFAQYTFDTSKLPWWARTMTDDEIRRVIRLIKDEGLKAEMRVELWLAAGDKYWQRSNIHPSSWSSWFRNYTAACVDMAKLAQEGGCDILTPLVELIEPERHTQEVKALLDAVAAVYSGDICVSQATHTLFRDLPSSSWQIVLGSTLGAFWDWSAGSRKVLIGMEYWPADEGIESQADTRFSVIVQNLVEFYAPIVSYFRTSFPSHPVRFCEMGSSEFDGAVMRGHWEMGNALPDHQEFADTYAALICMAAGLGVDVCVWSIWPAPEPNWYKPGQHYLNYMPVMDLVDAMIP